MKRAKRTDWTIKPLPSRRTTLSLDRSFEPPEMDRIRLGLVPEEMEDKWFIFWEDDSLFFHRSWTGYCIYVVRFVCDGGACGMVSAEVNRDPTQYRGVDDERDAELISYLVAVLLLHQRVVFPNGEAKPEDNALETWSLVGRAVLGEHPKDDQ